MKIVAFVIVTLVGAVGCGGSANHQQLDQLCGTEPRVISGNIVQTAACAFEQQALNMDAYGTPSTLQVTDANGTAAEVNQQCGSWLLSNKGFIYNTTTGELRDHASFHAGISPSGMVAPLSVENR